ncbi:MAG: FAD binding domain-containing protein [Hyphomicrobiaceae bacterium]
MVLARDFQYLPSVTVEAALSAMAGGSRPLAGGTDLVPQLREGRRSAPGVVDIKRIPEMLEIRQRSDGGVSIGAAAAATAVADDPTVRRLYPALADAARLIGSWQVQNRATLGGNICNAAPSADAVPALVCYGASVIVASPRGRSVMPLETVFRGPGRTNLAADALLVAIELPPPATRTACHYRRFTPRREMDIAIAGVAALVRFGDDGAIVEARIALASVGPTVLRAKKAEGALIGMSGTASTVKVAGGLAAEEAKPISDTRASADYRRTLVRVLTERTLADGFDVLAKTGAGS